MGRLTWVEDGTNCIILRLAWPVDQQSRTGVAENRPGLLLHDGPVGLGVHMRVSKLILHGGVHFTGEGGRVPERAHIVDCTPSSEEDEEGGEGRGRGGAGDRDMGRNIIVAPMLAMLRFAMPCHAMPC